MATSSWTQAMTAAVAVALVGCSTTASTPVSGGGPEWIDLPNGVYDDEGQKAIYSVGIAMSNPNIAARRSMAAARARQDMAATVSIVVQGLVQDYMATNRDFYDMDGASSTEYFEAITNQVTNETLVGSKQVDAWRDTENDSEYVLFRVDFDDVIHKYRERMQETAKREMQRKKIKVQKDAFEKKLEEQIERLEGMEGDEFNSEFTGAG